MRFLPAAALCALCGASAAHAAEDTTPARPKFDIMPFGGYVFGGSVRNDATDTKIDVNDGGSFGISLRMRPSYDKEWELFYSNQSTDVPASGGTGGTPAFDIDIEYLQFGGSYFPSKYEYAPYIIGGLGVTRFSPDGAGLSDESDFSIMLGFGIRFPFSEHFAVRLEGRGFLTFVDPDVAFFCSSSASGGVCAISADGSTYFQFETLLGVSFAF
jgi:opacity protein-like surface antigen